jgi:IS5 family transposase
VILRLFLLSASGGQVNLAYRWFIGYELDEALPDHSTLSKALDRFGDDVFNELLARSIAPCHKSGLIEGKVWHVDATTIRADLDKNQVNKPDRADREARFGRFADGSFQPGYKQQTVVDDHHGVIVGLSVTAANEADDPPLAGCRWWIGLVRV